MKIKILSALKHRFLMWWSPAYRDRHLCEAWARGFLEGLTKGIKEAEENPKPLAEFLADFENSPAFAWCQRTARVATFFYDEERDESLLFGDPRHVD